MTDQVDTPVSENGHPEGMGALPVDPVIQLQQQVAVLTWLLAEQTFRQMRIATMLAAMMAEKMQPQIQKAMLAQLTGGG